MEPDSQQSIDRFALLPNLIEFRNDGKFCDVKVQIGEEIFECHRVILAAISHFFNTMFQSDFKEGNGDHNKPIILHEVDPAAFREILNSIPTGHINVDDSNIISLLQANDFLQIRTAFIEEQCYEYLLMRELVDLIRIGKNSERPAEPLPCAIDLLLFAFLTKKQRFVDFMCDQILKHVRHYSKDARIMEIPFQVLSTILLKFRERTENFNMVHGSVNTLLNIVICWVNHSRAERGQHREQLLKCINSSCISTDYALTLLNTCENLLDKVTNRSDNVEWFADAYRPGSTPGVDIKFTTGTTCVFKVEDFKESWSEMISQDYRIRDMEWRILLERSSMPGYLSFFVQWSADAEFYPRWHAEVAFMILSQKEGKRDIVRTKSFALPIEFDVGFSDFIKWEDVIDEERGYIKDNSVIFQLLISF